MHQDILLVDKAKIKKPQGPVHIVYFSSNSNNTHRFVQKLISFSKERIPVDSAHKIMVQQDFVLITPCYCGGDTYRGAVPKQVVQFLNDPVNRKHCKAVIASGNTNFGQSFAVVGPILSTKLNVPLLYQFELLGTAEDVKNVTKILHDFFTGE